MFVFLMISFVDLRTKLQDKKCRTANGAGKVFNYFRQILLSGNMRVCVCVGGWGVKVSFS